VDTRLVRLGEEPKPWRRPESLAGLFVPAMAWLLALVGLVLEGLGQRCHRGARSNLCPSMTSCKQTTIFLCNGGLANHIGRRWLQKKSKMASIMYMAPAVTSCRIPSTSIPLPELKSHVTCLNPLTTAARSKKNRSILQYLHKHKQQRYITTVYQYSSSSMNAALYSTMHRHNSVLEKHNSNHSRLATTQHPSNTQHKQCRWLSKTNALSE